MFPFTDSDKSECDKDSENYQINDVLNRKKGFADFVSGSVKEMMKRIGYGQK